MRNLTRTEAKINAKMGKAIHDHGLIQSGDRILVAVSGGKDSLALLYMLEKIRCWAPVEFTVSAAHVTTDLKGEGFSSREELEQVFRSLDIDHFFPHASVLDENGETSCFWCSWNKRKALFDLAEIGSFNKIALGHHKDDIVQTVLLNLLFKGEISAMNPRQELFNGKLVLIRPLCYVEESLTELYAEEKGMPGRSECCTIGERSKRKAVREMLERLEKETPGTNIKTNVFNAISRIKSEYIGLEKEADDHEVPVLLGTEFSFDAKKNKGY